MVLIRWLALALVLTSCREGPKVVEYGPTIEEQAQAERAQVVEIVANLIDFDKLDTLRGDRAANDRVRKLGYWLEIARRNGHAPEDILKDAYQSNGDHGTARAQEATRTTLANLADLEAWGCFDAEGMAKLRRGNAPTIRKGLHAGQIVSVDHTLPRSIVDEVDEALYNLRLMPDRVNNLKGNTITLEEIQTARRWHREGLLSSAGLEAVERAAR